MGAIDKSVDRSPTACGIAGDVDGAPEDRSIEPAGDGEHRVSHPFEVKPLAAETPQPAIFRIDPTTFRAIETRLLIRIREEDPPMQPLDRPALLHEGPRQVIEQFRVRR